MKACSSASGRWHAVAERVFRPTPAHGRFLNVPTFTFNCHVHLHQITSYLDALDPPQSVACKGSESLQGSGFQLRITVTCHPPAPQHSFMYKLTCDSHTCLGGHLIKGLGRRENEIQ